MAPEQTESSRATVDRRTDVYGLGGVLYAALTGRAPFVGSTPTNVVVQVLKAPVTPPSALAPGIPPAVDALCVRALAKSPSDRPATAAELARELESLLESRGSPRVARWLGLGLAFALAGAAAIAASSRRSEPTATPLPPVPAPAQAPPKPPVLARDGSPVQVELVDLAGRTHRAEERLRARVSGSHVSAVEVAVGKTVTTVAPERLEAGVPIALGLGKNVVRVSVPGRGSAEREVWRFKVPGHAKPGSAPEEILAADGSVLVYHPPGRFLMGWNGVVADDFVPKNEDERPILPTVREAARSSPPDERDVRERSVVVRWKDADETGEQAAWSSLKNESPRHLEVLERGFFLGKHEVTWGDFRRWGQVSPDEKGIPDFVPEPTTPVYNVGWDDADAYCKAFGLRLPSDVEWEYAARGGDERRLFPFGDDSPEGTTDLANVGGLRGHPTPVGSFPKGASRWGCLDLAGNVYEWTGDSKYHYTAETGFDPRSNNDPARRKQGTRPLNLTEVRGDPEPRFQQRGGAFDRPPDRARSGFRVTGVVHEREVRTGFRVACDEPE